MISSADAIAPTTTRLVFSREKSIAAVSLSHR